MAKDDIVLDLLSKLSNQVETVNKNLQKNVISTVKIEEHMKSLNGSKEKHEKEIGTLQKEVKENRIDVTKLLTKASIVGGIVMAIITTILVKVLGG